MLNPLAGKIGSRPARKPLPTIEKALEHPTPEPKPIVVLLAGQIAEGETVRAVIACNDFLRLGPTRSIAMLGKWYREQSKAGAEVFVTSRSHQTLCNWSWECNWSTRAEIYDIQNEIKKDEAAESAMATGLALPYARVAKLKKLAMRLEDEIAVNLWVLDVRQIGSGRTAERVDLLKFNDTLIREYRGVLADLAEETGGRQKLNRNLNVNLDDLSDAQLEALAAGKDPKDVFGI